MYGSLGGDDVPLVPAKPAATGPQANPQSELRRDYELALQLGTRDGWEAFLAQYPEGFYANLAKGQLNKIGAEETRAAAEQKARTAEQEKARLIAERAQKAEQEKAAAAAKAAEEARIAAEKKKEIEQARAEAAERERKVAEAAAAKALAEKQAAEKVKAELAAKQAAEKAEQAARPAADRQMPEAEQKLATLSPAPTSTLSAADLTKSVQSELRRVGCLSGAAEGDWSATSQRSLALFNKYAGTQFDAKLASVDALDALKAKPGRVCPLVCNFGFKADGDQCVKITCRAGYRVGDDNECEKIPEKKPVATREDSRKRDQGRKEAESAAPKSQASGQMICTSTGCRPVSKGCRIERDPRPGSAGMSQVEVCH
ncbi:UNVERIFIED_ORG: chemotaxis protein histidine kinase CheA [Bradyrhizobium japonicum]